MLRKLFFTNSLLTCAHTLYTLQCINRKKPEQSKDTSRPFKACNRWLFLLCTHILLRLFCFTHSESKRLQFLVARCKVFRVAPVIARFLYFFFFTKSHWFFKECQPVLVQSSYCEVTVHLFMAQWFCLEERCDFIELFKYLNYLFCNNLQSFSEVMAFVKFLSAPCVFL